MSVTYTLLFALLCVALPERGPIPVEGGRLSSPTAGAGAQGDGSLRDAKALSDRSLELYRAGRYAEAVPPAEQSLAIYEKVLGPEHPGVAVSLNNLALMYYAQGRYAKAESLYLRAVAICEKVLGPDHPGLATSLGSLAQLYLSQGLYAKAEPLFVRALAIDERALGSTHPGVATDLNGLASLYLSQGQYAKAEPLYVRALAIEEKALGPNHPDVATSLNNLALLYVGQGQYAKAEPLYVRALAIREKALGPDHPDVAATLNNLAELCRTQGQYARAEALYTRALTIVEKVLGAEHPDVATSLNNLAGLYMGQGQYAKAEALYVQALAIRAKALGPNHPDVGMSLNNLAELSRIRGQAAKAESFYVRALAIFEKAFGSEHPYVATALNNLALLYYGQRQYAKAEPLYVRALAIREKALGPDHPDVGMSLNNLALLYTSENEYAKAEPLYVRALAIREKALGPEHPDVATNLSNLALMHFAANDLDLALNFQSRADDTREAEIRRNLASGSQQAKRLYLEQTSTETDLALSIQAACAPTNVAALRIALTQVLRRKGRALDALVDQLDALARSGSSDDRRVLGELSLARAELAALTLRGPGSEGVERHRRDLAGAGSRVDELEAQASARSARVRTELTPITLDGVRKAIPAGATLVEFATYQPLDTKTRSFGATRYVVYTLAPDGTIRWSDLGEAGPIDDAVVALRNVLRAGGGAKPSDVDAEVKPRARALDALVFAPVRALVGPSTRLLVAPDGQLSLVPFEALVDERGRYETEAYEISYLTSGRDLLRLTEHGESRQPATVLANPDFGGRGADTAAGRLFVMDEAGASKQTPGSTADVLARAYFSPLAGTAAEADALGKLLPDARVFTRAEASKERLTALAGPRVLHLATHGFFLAGPPPEAPTGRQLELSTNSPGPAAAQPETEDPLLRSGLAFAGANLHTGGTGILTSLEAAGLDLWGTKLVVLSACDTGVGEVRNGDGVYGLRRALVLAGSETQVMSMWPVSDAGTRDMMIGYYRRLVAGEGRSAAMRAVRLEMLKDPARRHPFYWASFIVSGEWANLDGVR